MDLATLTGAQGLATGKALYFIYIARTFMLLRISMRKWDSCYIKPFNSGLLCVGRFHGAVISNSEDWEMMCVGAGRVSGDLIQPLIYCPELHFNEFASAVADMKNSSAVSVLYAETSSPVLAICDLKSR